MKLPPVPLQAIEFVPHVRRHAILIALGPILVIIKLPHVVLQPIEFVRLVVQTVAVKVSHRATPTAMIGIVKIIINYLIFSL